MQACQANTVWPARGPGRLTEAVGIRQWVIIGAIRRIGITREVERRLRFFEQGNRFVSGTKRVEGVKKGGHLPCFRTDGATIAPWFREASPLGSLIIARMF